MTMIDTTLTPTPPVMSATQPEPAKANGKGTEHVTAADADLLKRMSQIEHLGYMVKSKVRDLGKAETAVAEADAARKEKMEARNKIQHQLDELHEELAALACGKNTERLFPPQNEKTVTDGKPDEAWRAVELSTLTPKIAAGKLKALREHEPVIKTLGDLVDWQAAKGQFWVKDIKGLGEKGQDQLAAACEAYWREHPQNPETPQVTPTPSEAFDDAAIAEATVEPVIDTEDCYLKAARRQNGRWAYQWFARVGKRNAGDPMWSGSFSDRDGAVAEAAEKVWEFADAFIKSPKTPKKQRDQAKEIVAAIDRLDKKLAAEAMPDAAAQGANDAAVHEKCNPPKEPIEQISEAIKEGRKGRKCRLDRKIRG